MPKWLILLSAFSTAALASPAWRWVDANGQVHYSDVPVPGATQVELQGAQTFGNGPARRQTPAAAATQAPSAPANGGANAATAYRSFNIVSPSQQQTLWGTGSVLSVQLELQPALQPGHR